VPKLYNDSVQVASEKIKWQRNDVASKIVDFEQARHKQSQRQFAIEQAVSRSMCSDFSKIQLMRRRKKRTTVTAPSRNTQVK
jgi:hypothetical protein